MTIKTKKKKYLFNETKKSLKQDVPVTLGLIDTIVSLFAFFLFCFVFVNEYNANEYVCLCLLSYKFPLDSAQRAQRRNKVLM